MPPQTVASLQCGVRRAANGFILCAALMLRTKRSWCCRSGGVQGVMLRVLSEREAIMKRATSS